MGKIQGRCKTTWRAWCGIFTCWTAHWNNHPPKETFPLIASFQPPCLPRTSAPELPAATELPELLVFACGKAGHRLLDSSTWLRPSKRSLKRKKKAAAKKAAVKAHLVEFVGGIWVGLVFWAFCFPAFFLETCARRRSQVQPSLRQP